MPMRTRERERERVRERKRVGEKHVTACPSVAHSRVRVGKGGGAARKDKQSAAGRATHRPGAHAETEVTVYEKDGRQDTTTAKAKRGEARRGKPRHVEPNEQMYWQWAWT